MKQNQLKTDIKDLSRDELIEWLEEKGIASYRAGQILRWIYLRQTDTFDSMTDLKKNIRDLLDTEFIIRRLETVKTQTSKDGAVKYLFRLPDDHLIESVLIPEKEHMTLCISSQVGCAQGCKFCLTAKGGFLRNLTPGEIIAQIRDIADNIDTKTDNGHPGNLTNIVLMGMGEPLANYKNVVKAMSIITDSDCGLGFSRRRVTLSTAGLVNRLADMGNDIHANLAISLNAADNKTRTMLMPVNRIWPIESLIDACIKFPVRPNRRITFEYILIKGINDSPEDAKNLAGLLRNVQAKINLIPFNEHTGSDFKRPDPASIDRFQQILIKNRYTTIIRNSKGLDISAACGQLRATMD
ncbi:23S rRNA (adenine(2503)-C(2))-methyltransferase RlmN [Desulfobacterales bacterium HSG16]|nr:23S rRNA (adenine(2503)-C(2))-methyltransferase RlmN [Desulfobacterales bacterium HSG16]